MFGAVSGGPSCRIITYIFLCEGTAGLIVVKSWNRVLGTVIGATLGWLVLFLMENVPGVNYQRAIVGTLVAGVLGVGQYGKTVYKRPYGGVISRVIRARHNQQRPVFASVC